MTLLRALTESGYRFITPAPDDHRRALRGRDHRAADLQGVFGWSLPFREGDIPAAILALMEQGGVLARHGGRLKSRVRVASLGERLFLHSAFPPRGRDAVFFGPDSYRFADLIGRELGEGRGGRIVDIGAGSGVGGIVAAGLRPEAKLVLADINPAALRLAAINAAAAGVEAKVVQSNGLAGVDGSIDIALANPPYLGGLFGRTYRDGGGRHGTRLSLDWAKAAAARLSPGGRLLLYTGSAIVRGEDRLERALRPMLAAAGCSLRYGEIEPDVFGGMRAHPVYWGVERIAAVGAVAVKDRPA